MNASVMISELSMSHISSISGHERSSRTIFCTSGAGVWYRTIEAFIIGLDRELFFGFVEGSADDFVHIVVRVFGKATTEDEVVFLRCKGSIFEVKSIVVSIVDRVVCLLFAIPRYWVFASDDGLRLGAIFEVLVLDDASEWHLFFGIVDYGIALIVVDVEQLMFEFETTIFKFAIAIVEILVKHTSVDNGLSKRVEFATLFVVVDIELNVAVFE